MPSVPDPDTVIFFSIFKVSNNLQVFSFSPLATAASITGGVA